MTDRELLELAAKEAGVEGTYRAQYAGDKEYGGFWHSGVCWNPLTDDGDALRLAVKLNLGLVHGWEDLDEAALATIWISHDGKCVAEEVKANDPYAATRRAIVRAAAEIGRGMK